MRILFLIALSYFAGSLHAATPDKSPAEAMRQLEISAVQGSATAQAALGEAYFNEMNYPEALNWLRRADLSGSVNAKFIIGTMYLHGIGLPHDTQKGIRIISEVAELGLLEAQELLARIYETSEANSVEKDFREALKWRRKAAEQGSISSQRDLGNMYYDSIGDKEESLKWYREAATRGDYESRMKLGGVLQYSNPKESQKWYLLAAETGDSVAQYAVAQQFSEGPEELRDEVQAYKWYRRLAKQNHLSAAAGLSVLFKHGAGVPTNVELSYVLQIIARGQDKLGLDWALSNVPSPEVSSLPPERRKKLEKLMSELVKPGNFTNALDAYLAEGA